MAKRMNLEDTWRRCLSMWRFVAKRIKKDGYRNRAQVDVLKEEWCRKHGFENIAWHCFFCEHVADDPACKPRRIQPNCPGRKIDREFNCRTSAYEFDTKPIAFYNKLVSLNRKRLKNKKG